MSRQIINYKSLKDKSREEILKFFLDYITVKDAEDKTVEERKLSKSWKPHLKFLIVRSYNFNPNLIEHFFQDKIFKEEDLSQDLIRQLLDNFSIFIKPLNEKSTNNYLVMEEYKTKKKYHFIIFSDKKYWIIITLTNKDDLDKTIFRIIKLIDNIEIIKITPNHLEGLVYNQKYEKNIKGFIAKYKPYFSERKITIDVHGGNLNDLDKMRSLFFVEPTQFQFGLKNSPVSIIEGKVFTKGNFTLEKIQQGYHDLAIETIQNLTSVYEDINKVNYEDIELYENKLIKNKDNNGLTINSWFIIVIKIKGKRFIREKKDLDGVDKITYKELNDSIVKYFKNRRRRYKVYSNKQYSHFICDQMTRNKVQLTIEPKDNNIIIYPFNRCNSKTIRDICNGINDVESSLEVIKPFSYKYN